MEKNIIYEEKIFPKVDMWILGVGIAFIVLVMALMLIRISNNLIREGVGLFDLLVILFVILFIFFMPAIVFVIIAIMYISRGYNIKITPDSVIIDCGFDKRTIPFEKIDDCYLLEKRSIITRWIPRGLNPSTYIGRVNGKWRLRSDVSIIGYPRVVLSLKDAKFFKDFVFSTKNFKEVMEIINKKINVTTQVN